MRTRPDAQQETLARRLALLRADPSNEREASPRSEVGDESDGWWDAHTNVPQEPVRAAVASGQSAEPPAVEAVVQPVAVPVPGRHAARRSLGLLPRLPGLPETLHGRVRLGPAQLAVVALILAAALALTCWWLARGRATALSAPVAAPSTAAPLVGLSSPSATPVVAARATATASSGAAVSSGSSAEAMVTVDVEGKVRHPGIVVLPTGSRVTDALTAAGGVPHRRSLHGLNLAAVLVDGQQIMVGAAAPAGGGTVSAGSAGSGSDLTGAGAASAPVNLNTATAEQLDTLPGVGPVTAQSILEWREQNGGFTSVEQLLDVDGIGPATLAKLTPHVTV